MRTYKVQMSFVFNGHVEVKANNIDDAQELVAKNINLDIGVGLTIGVNHGNIGDYNFETHPIKVIESITYIGQK